MALQDLVIRSQLIAPWQRKGVMRCPRRDLVLRVAVHSPALFTKAGAGYGRSIAQSTVTSIVHPLLSYSVTEPIVACCGSWLT